MSNPVRQTPLPVAGWIILCAFLNCAGWALSAVRQLNVAGYSVAVLLGLVGLVIWRPQDAGGCASLHLFKLTRRFRKPFPLSFLILASLAFAGGAVHPPTNFDGLAYRTPRVLQWLAAGGWHWIHTGFQRLNVRAVGFEWVTAPVLLFTHTDRFLFLINIVSFLLLPGLIFGVFTRLGVRPRVAWYWMWLLPSGYGFLLQSGSIGNDLFGAVFGLAALDLALRARSSGRVSDLWLSCLAAALATGGKTSNLPLMLPWFVAVLPSLPLIRRKLVQTFAVGMAAACASFLPVAASNLKRCGDWTGQAVELGQYMKGQPVLYLTQNTLLLAIQNLEPPIFPMANVWNNWVKKRISPERQARLDKIFEPVGAHLAVGELEMEEGAGLGLGVGFMLLASVAGTFFSKGSPRRSETPSRQVKFYRNAVLVAAWISVVPYMAASGASTPARLVIPYYCLIVPVFLLGQTGDWIKRNRWWQCAGLLVFFVAGVVLVLSPARPLWPAQAVFARLNRKGNAALARAATVYQVYHERPAAFAPVCARLPADADVLGLISFDDPETSLWKPFFKRRVLHVLPGDSVEFSLHRGIRYVLISPETITAHYAETVAQWVERNHAEVVWTMPLKLRASRESAEWTLAKLPPAGTKGL